MGHGARVWEAEGTVHIDVRGLDPPQPLLAIIELIEEPETGGPVIVHHDRDPIMLYPELAERGWDHEHLAAPSGEVRLRLSRATA
ncbi:MAG: DUF2249 domain-containing protein [Alphaproteobacteria bacterium]|nr:DUF2249 domain-containing protein [Alphaproteobacteria bacterium]